MAFQNLSRVLYFSNKLFELKLTKVESLVRKEQERLSQRVKVKSFLETLDKYVSCGGN